MNYITAAAPPPGAADSEAALRKRRERYRLELQEQIAEQHRNKRR